MLFVLLTVGAVVLARAPRSEEEIDASETLVWADVERQFERVDRQSTRDRTGGRALRSTPARPSARGPPRTQAGARTTMTTP